MRMVLAAFFIAAVAIPEASALPALNSDTLELSVSAPVAQVAKRKAAPPKRKAAKDNGIHPLVGSGGY
jgi:hypothetical protein